MPIYDYNLYDCRGSVLQRKPNASAETIDEAINKRIAAMYDEHPWSDSLKVGVININQAYSAGRVLFSGNSNIVTGTGTNWPTNDLVNSVIPNGIVETGYQEVSPGAGAMANIKPGTYILVDPNNAPNTEVVLVIEVTHTTFWATFATGHGPNVVIWVSSLAGRQFKADRPTYTVQAVLSATSLQIDSPWQGPVQPAGGLAYNILDGYLSVTPNTRRIMFCWDPIASNPLDLNHSMEDLSIVDPQRSTSNSPNWLVQMPPNPASIAQWELWPYQTSPYQLSVVSSEQWPRLKRDTDRPPHFFNPHVIIAGAVADVLRIKNLSRSDRQDPYFDPTLAREYEAEFQNGLQKAYEVDQARQATALSSYIKQITGSASTNWSRNRAVYADGTDPWG